jgi:transposase
VLPCATNTQEYCVSCSSRLSRTLLRARVYRCDNCKGPHIPFPPSSPLSSPEPASSPSLFDRQSHSHLPLSPIERSAAVVLTRIGETQQQAAEQLGSTRQAVARWNHRFEETREVEDRPRSGRPRETTEEEDELMVMTSTVEHFLTPRRMKRKLELDVSPHTIDRRLQEANLNGRVAQHKHTLTEDEKRKRLSFAEGYRGWKKKDWDRVLFSDEKIFYGAGFCGHAWVRRPPGQALNPEYCVDKKPHPVKVNVWGCFTGRGLGYSYIFNETLDAKLLKSILSTHLLPSAKLLFNQDPPEQWYFQQDNDPKHRSREITNWLHNNGISCLDFPPYSPDLNPMEHLWNDMARRVEKHQSDTLEQLQEVVATEWATTSTNLLTKLAHSMPKRCEAVIKAKGGHTKY